MSQATRATEIEANLRRVRERIAAAARRCGRSADSVRLVAVTKYADLENVRALLRVGQVDLGENRVQQLRERVELLGAAGALLEPEECSATGAVDTPPPCWHMIGTLQRNKVKYLLPAVRIIHGVDSLRLGEQIQREAEKADATVDALLEFNISGEQSKRGLTPAEAPGVAEAVASLERLNLRGLMTMAPFETDPATTRPYFAELRELSESLRKSGAMPPDATELSMGMSNDFEIAIEEGATIVRVGSALFENPGAADA